MVPRRCLATLCSTLLAPSLAWAAPPELAEPPVEPIEQPAGEPGEPPDESADPADPEGALPPADAPIAESPSPVAELPASDPEPDLSNLLVSDQPEQPEARVRVQQNPAAVDRSERLRNYYARVYRPEHNPSRIHFGARGAYAFAGTTDDSGGGKMGFANVELGQTWNWLGYAIGATVFAGSMTFGEQGVENFAPVLVGGGPSLGLGRLGLFGRGYLDLRVGYNFFYAPVSTTRAELSDPPDASPHGPKVQVDVGLLMHDSESRRFRHGFGATIGWQMLVHTFTGEYPRVNSFMIGIGYFFG